MSVVARPVVEWPTVTVAVAIYAGWAGLTLAYHDLPWWLILALGGYLVAWHGSVQHEVVHGHPTPWTCLNRALVFPSLWLWMPLEVYADTHMRHHRDEIITDPVQDPESYYLSPRDWARTGPIRRACLRFLNTSIGRLLMGPPVVVWRLLTTELRALAGGDRRHLAAWFLHVLGCVPVLLWVALVCDMPVVAYLLLFVYPGISLTLLRSFAEHRARPMVGERTGIVESGPLLSLLFLNNNLHRVHHDHPGAAWYRLPAIWRARRDEVLADNGGYRFSGYGEVIRRYAFTSREPVAWPIDNGFDARALSPSGGEGAP